MDKVMNVSCANKASYITRAKAERKLRLIWKTSLFSQKKKPCRTYKCPSCGMWHLTSKALKTKEQLQQERAGVDK